MSVDATFDDLMARDKEATDVAKVTLAKAMILLAPASDFTSKQVIFLTILEAIQQKISSDFIGNFVNFFKNNRKSLNRKDRKEFQEMFKSLEQQDKTKMEKIKQLFGFGE